jgi:uncharacterized protein YjbJ (UPF0337 family)
MNTKVSWARPIVDKITRLLTKEFAMDNDRFKGAVDQTKGAVKEAIGKTIGDKKMQAEGTVDKLTGKLESAVGKAKEDLRDVVNKGTK